MTRIVTTEPPGLLTEWTERFGAALMGSAPPPMAVLVRGEGCYVWDSEGNRYLDFLAGIAVNSLGHAHPVLVDAVSRQVATLAHISNYFASPSQIELAERLKRISGAGDAGRVYFGNSAEDAANHGFDDAFIYEELQRSFPDRKIEMIQLMREDALAAFVLWTAKTDKFSY